MLPAMICISGWNLKAISFALKLIRRSSNNVNDYNLAQETIWHFHLTNTLNMFYLTQQPNGIKLLYVYPSLMNRPGSIYVWTSCENKNFESNLFANEARQLRENKQAEFLRLYVIFGSYTTCDISQIVSNFRFTLEWDPVIFYRWFVSSCWVWLLFNNGLLFLLISLFLRHPWIWQVLTSSMSPNFRSAQEVIGAVTHTMVNAISRGKLSLAISHSGFREGRGDLTHVWVYGCRCGFEILTLFRTRIPSEPYRV